MAVIYFVVHYHKENLKLQEESSCSYRLSNSRRVWKKAGRRCGPAFLHFTNILAI